MSFNSFFSKCHTKTPTMTGVSHQSRQTMTSAICRDEIDDSPATPFYFYNFLTSTLNLDEMIRGGTSIDTSLSTLNALFLPNQGIDMSSYSSSINIPYDPVQYPLFPTNNISYQIDIYVDNRDDNTTFTQRLKYATEFQYLFQSFAVGWSMKQNYNQGSDYGHRTRFYFNTDGSIGLNREDDQFYRTPVLTTHGIPSLERTGHHTLTINLLHDYMDNGVASRKSEVLWDDVVINQWINSSTTILDYTIIRPFFIFNMSLLGGGLSQCILKAFRFYDRVIPSNELFIPFVSVDNYKKCYTNLSDNFTLVNATTTSTRLIFENTDGYTYVSRTKNNNVLDLHNLDENPLYFEFQMFSQVKTTTLFHFGNFVSAQPTTNIDFSLYTGLFWGAINRQYCLRIGDYTHIFGNVEDPQNITTWALYLTLDSCKFYHNNRLQTTVLNTDHPYFWVNLNSSLAGQGFLNRVNLDSTGNVIIEHVMKMSHVNLSQSYPSTGLEVSQSDLVMHYDFTLNSPNELIHNEPYLTMQPFGGSAGSPMGFMTHPDQAGKYSVYLDQESLTPFARGFELANGIITEMPTANYSIQFRFYLFNPENTVGQNWTNDLWDTRTQFTQWRQSYGVNNTVTPTGQSYYYYYHNGRSNNMYFQLLIDNVMSAQTYNDNVSYDTHTTGYKCITLVFDTLNNEARSYNNGILIAQQYLAGDFALGLIDQNVSALRINTVGGGLAVDQAPSSQYFESIKVFNRVLTQPETYY